MATSTLPNLTRRNLLAGLAGGAAALSALSAARAEIGFDQWVAQFRSKAVARGVSDETYTRVMPGVQPDMTGLNAIHNQPEFNQQLWQYLNRAASDWRTEAGKAKAKEYASLLARITRDFGVEPSFMLGVWGIESAFGDPLVEKNHSRPVIPSLATLAWAEPRRRAYWEGELINALTIIQRGWSTPEEMVGSWAGAMGHTQWMPEVWLHMGIDYDGDGKISPYGPPDDALATTARYFVERGNYRRGEHWGYEVRMKRPISGTASRNYAKWQALGVVRADGEPFPQPNATARAWLPVAGGRWRHSLICRFRRRRLFYEVQIIFNQVKRQQDLNKRALQGVIPAGPSVENAALKNQAIKPHRRRRHQAQPPHPVRKIQSLPISSEQFVSLEHSVFLLCFDPATQRFSVVVQHRRTQHLELAIKLNLIGMAIRTAARRPAAIQDRQPGKQTRTQSPAPYTVA